MVIKHANEINVNIDLLNCLIFHYVYFTKEPSNIPNPTSFLMPIRSSAKNFHTKYAAFYHKTSEFNSGLGALASNVLLSGREELSELH